MANVQKNKLTSVGHLFKHYERGKDETSEYIKFGNQNIDPQRTYLNYNLAPNQEKSQMEILKNRLSEVKYLKRSDVNVMCSWVVTLPKGVEQDRTFFEETYRFLSERYGNENVVSAYVHMDEKQPHIHFSFVPVVVGKNGKEKVSAKELLTKLELQRFHPELQAALERSLGRDIPILNGATAGGNQTVAELKAKEATAKALETVEKAAVTVQKTKSDIETLQGQRKALQGEIQALQGRLLTEQEVKALKGQKTITGALKGVKYEDYENLHRTALRVGKVDAERDKAIKRAEAAEQNAAAAEERAIQAQNDKPSLKMITENAKWKSRFYNLERRFEKLLAALPASELTERIRAAVQAILADRDPFHQRQAKSTDRDIER